MTDDEARALFDAAHDGELDAETKRAFESALSADAALRSEYQAFERALSTAAAFGRDLPAVDLLSGVQQKLRARSGGRFYRDQFAEQRGRSSSLTWMLALSSVVLIAVSVWFALDAFSR